MIKQVNNEKGYSSYSVTWDAKDDNDKGVSSGVYFYSLDTDNVKLQKTMLLLR